MSMREKIIGAGVPERVTSFATRGESLTRQDQALDADVNSIVARFIAHGTVAGAPGEARYGDFSEHSDYKNALDRVLAAQADFADLPADIRKECNNDVGEFLSRVYDAEKRAELELMGLRPDQDPSKASPPAGQAGSSPEAAQEAAEGTQEGTTDPT